MKSKKNGHAVKYILAVKTFCTQGKVARIKHRGGQIRVTVVSTHKFVLA